MAIEDITERKRAGEAQKILAAIVGSSDDAIDNKDVKGIINSWNQGAERLFGYTAEEAIGQSVSILIPPERKVRKNVFLNAFTAANTSITMKPFAKERMEVSSILHSLFRPSEGHKGRIIGASKIARDTGAQTDGQ